MTVRRLVNLFSCFSITPVEVSEIRDQIVDWGFHDSRAIQFCPWSLNLASQQGWWHHAVPYSQGETPVCRGDHIAVVPA